MEGKRFNGDVDWAMRGMWGREMMGKDGVERELQGGGGEMRDAGGYGKRKNK